MPELLLNAPVLADILDLRKIASRLAALIRPRIVHRDVEESPALQCSHTKRPGHGVIKVHNQLVLDILACFQRCPDSLREERVVEQAEPTHLVLVEKSEHLQAGRVGLDQLLLAVVHGQSERRTIEEVLEALLGLTQCALALNLLLQIDGSTHDDRLTVHLKFRFGQ